MTDNLKQRSGAEMRALRDQRLAAQADPATEARRREAAFRKNLTGARDDLEWIVEHQAWRHLGYASLAEWWEARVQPIMRELSMHPSREIAAVVMDQVRKEEAELPPAQRRTQREVGEMVGVSEATVGRRAGTRSTSATNVDWRDLDKTPRPNAAPKPRAPEQDPEPVLCPACGQPLKEQR